MSQSTECICAGHVCLDIIPTFPAREEVSVEEVLSPGSLVIVGKAQLAPGGPVSNVGIALYRLGVRTEFMGKVGDDLFGEGLLALFKPYKADRAMTVVPGEVTSYTVVVAPPGVDRIFFHNPGANDTYGYDDVNFSRVAESTVFHLGYPPLMRRLYEQDGRELAAIFKAAKEAGAATSLDMAFPDPGSPAGRVKWRTVLAATLPWVDIFVPSCEELMFMLDPERFWERRREAGSGDPVLVYRSEDLRFLAHESLSLGAGIVVLKAGARGLYLATGSPDRLKSLGRLKTGPQFARRELWQPAYKVREVASATGSGDNAIAAFLTGLLRGLPPEMCLHAAAAVGADNLRVLDATSGVRPWEEVIESLPQREILDPQIGEAFSYREELGLYQGDHDGKGLAA